MGIRRAAFEKVNGYDETLKCGEDVDLSLRLQESGFTSAFIPDAEVYHKRRTTLKKFFKQVYRFGAARIDLSKRHAGQMKITHLFPLFFSLYVLGSVLLWFLGFSLPLAGLALYLIAIWLHSTIQTKNPALGILSMLTSLTMFLGYGWGLLKNGLHHTFTGQGLDL